MAERRVGVAGREGTVGGRLEAGRGVGSAAPSGASGQQPPLALLPPVCRGSTMS